MEERKHSYIVGGNVDSAVTMGNCMEVSQKTKYIIELPYDPTVLLLGIYPEKDKNTNLKRYMHPSVHSSTTSNSHDMEATQVPMKRQMDNKDVEYIYTYIQYYITQT